MKFQKTKITAMSKFLILLLASITLTACAVELSQNGSNVKLIQNQKDYDCNFVGTVSGSNELGWDTAHDAEGAMNEARNKAANLGANAIRIINVSTSQESTTTTAEALRCKF